MSALMEYLKKHGPRVYPDTHKRCMECGEVIPWEDDCSHGHFARIGREIRRKATETWTNKRVGEKR